MIMKINVCIIADTITDWMEGDQDILKSVCEMYVSKFNRLPDVGMYVDSESCSYKIFQIVIYDTLEYTETNLGVLIKVFPDNEVL